MSRKIKKTFIAFLLLLFGATNIYAADHYIAQTAAGSGNGDSCANATAISYYTGSWSGKVSAGDTVHLCGTITSQLAIGGSGTAGNVITVKFETGAKFSSTVWGSTGAIYGSGVSYIVVDGGSNGIVENTANGDLLANHVTTTGVYFTGSSYIEVKNLTIQNMYIKVYGNTTYGGFDSPGIMFYAGNNNISVHDCIINNTATGVEAVNTTATTITNIEFYNLTITRSNWGIGVSAVASSTTTNVKIHNNDITIGSNWSGDNDYYHSNGMYIYGVYNSSTFTNTQIYNNYIHGEVTPDGAWAASGFIHFDYTNATGSLIFNNLLVGVSGDPQNGYIDLNALTDPSVGIYNNTIIGTATGYGMGIYVQQTGSTGTTSFLIKNNIITGVFAAKDYLPWAGSPTVTPLPDYNSFYNNSNVSANNWSNTLASWQTYLGGCPGTNHECNSISTNPNLNSDYTPKVTSPIVGTGVNLTSLGITALNSDKAGTARPTTGAWDMGAYKYGVSNQSTLLVTSVNGTVTSSPTGINCGSTCSANYDSGTSVTLTALANSGYTFTGWSGGGCSGTGTCTVTMNAATFVTATFATTAYNLTVTKPGTGVGTVTGSDGLINCGSTCSVNYASGKSVTLAASATSGSIFSGWSGGGCSGTGTCTVIMTAATSVTATFTPVYNLTVTKSVAAAGTVTSSDSIINCGSTCSANYNPGTSVTLTAWSNSGYTFTGWLGGGCSGTGTCTVSMTAATSVTASFAISVYNLAVTKSGTKAGTVTGSDGLVNCGSTCSVNYESGKSVTLTALTNSGSTFSGWSGGGCSGTGTCTITMTAAKSVTATFATPVYNLTVTKPGPGSGTVTSGPSGINCGSTCSANYTYGTVTLTASAANGSTFSGWSGACYGRGTCTVTMTAAKSVTATFTKSWLYSKKRW